MFPTKDISILEENILLRTIELNKIYNEDCLIGMKQISAKSIDCILTDPHYNTTNCDWDEEINIDTIWYEWKRILKPNGVVLIF